MNAAAGNSMAFTGTYFEIMTMCIDAESKEMAAYVQKSTRIVTSIQYPVCGTA